MRLSSYGSYVKGGLLRAALGAALLIAGCTPMQVKNADRLATEGQWDQAVAAYREAVKKQPFDQDLKKRADHARIKAAEEHYNKGQQLLEEKRSDEALDEFKQALGLDPTLIEHHAALNDALRLKEARTQLQAAEKLHSLGRLDEALENYERAAELDPSLSRALDGITTVTEQQHSDKLLTGSNQPVTLRFQNTKLKEAFEVIAKAGGINVVFDKDLRDDPITFYIKDMPFQEALSLALSTNGLFARRIGPKTLLILPNVKQKQDQYQDLMIRTFYLSNAKAKDIMTLLRTMLDSKRVYVNEQINAVVVRDNPDKLRLAERIILANDRRDSEVQFDVEVLEVNRTKSQQYGVNIAKRAGAGFVPPGFTGALSADAPTQFTLQQLTSLGASSFLFTLPASMLLDFFKQEVDARTLASPKLRVVNNKQASINVGDKQPILLSTTNVLPGQAATGAVPTTSTVTSIEFKDTGVKLSVEPTIHLTDELTLKLKIEVTRLGEKVVLQTSPEVTAPKFGTRTAETVLNMKDDETVILAGLIQDEDRKNRVTIPWLGDIPIIGHLFSRVETDTVTTEVFLTITPHIIRNVNTPPVDGQTFWSGTETTYSTSPMFQDNHKPDDLSAPAHLPEPPPTMGKTPAAGQIVPEERMRLHPGGTLPPQSGPMMPSLPAERGR